MIRERIEDPWREVSWDEAINHTAAEFKRYQAKYGRGSIGGNQFIALHERGNVSCAEAC